MRSTNKRLRLEKQAAFSLVEMLVVVAIVALLALLSIPAIRKVFDVTQLAGCSSNMRQLHHAILQYAVDNDGALPWAYKDGRGAWSDAGSPVPPLPDLLGYAQYSITQRLTMKTVFRCPARKSGPLSSCDYAANASLMGFLSGTSTLYPFRKLGACTQPSSIILLADKNVEGGMDANKWFDDQYWPYAKVLVGRHSGRVNCLYLDGHLASKPLDQITSDEVRWR